MQHYCTTMVPLCATVGSDDLVQVTFPKHLRASTKWVKVPTQHQLGAASLTSMLSPFMQMRKQLLSWGRGVPALNRVGDAWVNHRSLSRWYVSSTLCREAQVLVTTARYLITSDYTRRDRLRRSPSQPRFAGHRGLKGSPGPGAQI